VRTQDKDGSHAKSIGVKRRRIVAGPWHKHSASSGTLSGRHRSGGSGSLNRISASLSGNSCQGLGQRGSA
jgi:hypothetical protein